ncbi:MAG TPA: DUF4388 domain-containing protein [Vicinamibacteria bacterium]
MEPAQDELDLTQTLVAEEVLRVRAEGWSGVLALRQGQVAKGLYVVDGEIAFAASTMEEDRLGACLHRAGLITESQFRSTMRESEATGQPFGHAVVDLGYVRAFDLAVAVRSQVERIVLSVLRWTSGWLAREPMDRPLPADLAVRVDTPRLLLLGVRQFSDTERLARALGGPERRIRRVSPSPFDYDDLEVQAAERAVLAFAARPVLLGEVLALPHPYPRLVRAAYALLVGGLVEDAPVGRVAAASPAAASPSTPPPPPPGPEEAERAARGLLERGFRQRAVDLLEETLERHPGAHGPRRLLALTLAREGGFQPAVERLFVDSLERAPEDVEMRYALASYYRRSGLAARAVLQLKRVLSSDSGHAGAWRDLGELEAGESRGKR